MTIPKRPRSSEIVASRAVATYWGLVARALENGYTFQGIANQIASRVGAELSVEAVRKAIRRRQSAPARPTVTSPASQPLDHSLPRSGKRSAAAVLLGEPEPPENA